MRPPAVAGSFYPAGAAPLGRAVTGLLAGARTRPRAGIRGLIAPHAGYAHSGPTAAEAFAALGAGRLRRAIVIGPAHFVAFRGIAAPTAAAFRTPLGELPVDGAALAALVEAGLAVADDAPHAPDHALEVELPFLQAQLGGPAILPLLFGETEAAAVAEAIARLWDEDTLLVVSSDLSHFEDDAAARAHDLRTAAAIEALDQAAIGPRDACGHLAIRGALIEAARRGLRLERLDLSNSGDSSGDRARVVGYGAWAMLAPEGAGDGTAHSADRAGSG